NSRRRRPGSVREARTRAHAGSRRSGPGSSCRRAVVRGGAALQQMSQAGGGRSGGQIPYRQRQPAIGANLPDEADSRQRMTTFKKEIVVDSQLGMVEDLGKQAQQAVLKGRTRSSAARRLGRRRG